MAAALTTSLAYQSSASASPRRLLCGSERWAVKTLADAAATQINFHPQSTTVSALRQLVPTHTSAREPGVERTTYRIRADLLEAKRETDLDIHLVVAEPHHHSRTMIVEFPAASCTTHSIHRRQMSNARAAFVSACGNPPSSSFAHLTGRATITGVGFFDFKHNQRGLAPNAIELHPVLGFSRASC